MARRLSYPLSRALSYALGNALLGAGKPVVPGPPIASAQGRRSAVNLTMPWRSPLVVPDGSFNKKDRQQLVYAYSDIAA